MKKAKIDWETIERIPTMDEKEINQILKKSRYKEVRKCIKQKQ